MLTEQSLLKDIKNDLLLERITKLIKEEAGIPKHFAISKVEKVGSTFEITVIDINNISEESKNFIIPFNVVYENI